MRKSGGFTLIELMIVVAVLGILSSMAVPSFQEYIIRGQVSEALQLGDGIKKAVHEYYTQTKHFPADNAAANVPKAEHLLGNYVTGIQVENGAVHITLGNRINAHAKGKILTLRPAVVTANPASPIDWVCGYAEAVNGMNAQGENKTSVPAFFLAPECRSWAAQRT